MAKILLKYEIDDEELWSAVCGSAWEMNSWWWAAEYEGGDWDEPCTLWVAIANPDSDHWFEDGVTTATITLDDIVRAIEELFDHAVVMHCLREMDFDSSYGDVVMQQAIFGDVIYA